MRRFIYLVSLVVPILAEWQPSFPSQDYGLSPQYYQGQSNKPGTCDLFKIGLSQELYQQYVQYENEMPDLKEFTLCMWTKFNGHGNDHPLFSYAVKEQPRALYSWISNSQESSYFSMAIDGHTFYRLNYPLKLKRWYHVCQSWNSKTGEWQIWVNAERVGRGFHNRLVGHIIPGGGTMVSGQELVDEESPLEKKVSTGMTGEVTMVQLYKVALTAGKAHKDHKHHHAHKFDLNGQPITTPPPTTTTPRSTLPTHPLLTGGQINRAVRINAADPNNQPIPLQSQVVQGQNFPAQYVNGQFIGSLLTQQFSRTQPQPQLQPQPIPQISGSQQQPQVFLPQVQAQPEAQQPLISNNLGDIGSFSEQTFTFGDKQLLKSTLEHPVSSPNVQYLEETQRLFKRDVSGKPKRDVFLGGGLLGEDNFIGGLATIGENQPVLVQQKEDEREPAEAEVMAVMNICSGCDEEPFAKALLFGWRSVSKKLFGATYAKAVPQCRVF